MSSEAKRRLYATNQKAFGYECLKILTKVAGKGLIPYHMNSAQVQLNRVADRQLKERGYVRIITVKGRQLGVSTGTIARGYWKTSFNSGVKAYLMSHELASTRNLYAMANRFYDNTPPSFRPTKTKSNQNELMFGGIDSNFQLGTAGNKQTGRSSTIHYLATSEVAYWGDNASDIASGLFEAVGDAQGTEIIMESTAAGRTNYFGQQILKAQSGESGFEVVFFPWTDVAEYSIAPSPDFIPDDYEKMLVAAYGVTLEQLAWRRMKLSRYADGTSTIEPELRFKYEYPLSIGEALEHSESHSLMSSADISFSRSRESNAADWMLLGIDPSRGGKDKTVITARRGDVAFVYPRIGVQSKTTETSLAGDIIGIIKKEGRKIVGINIDTTGGFGAGTYDILVERGYGELINPIVFSGKAFNQKEYVNIRAEMYFMLRKDLVRGQLQIPDNEQLVVELGAITEKPNSSGRHQLDKKSDIQKKIGRSPDYADSLALTYAVRTIHTERARGDFEGKTRFDHQNSTPQGFG